MKSIIIALAVASVLTVPAAAITITSPASGRSVSSFGYPDSRTYGQVFHAPVTGKLTSFTLYLNGGVGALQGGVGSWNGNSTYAFGNGSPTNLFLSSEVPSLSGGAYNFATNIAVTAGSYYVAYLSTYGVADATTATSMPLGTGGANVDFFVWNNTTDPKGNTSWNYFFNIGAAQFDATFSATPEPAAWALMITGFGMVGAAARRRRSGYATA